ncbi:MAG: hypothetical protein JWL64_238 [Frankiales bacterium]|nr:hypothetical protein [Frankiales bacterium]
MPDLPTAPPDPVALRRRVLATGVLTLLLFFAASFVVATVHASSWWLLLAVAVLYTAVTRPLLSPVSAAIKLRRRLAYQAFLEQRPDRDGSAT